MQQHFPVELPDDLLRKDETGLVFGKQPVNTAFLPGDALMFAKGLAPTPEISGITLEFTFQHHWK
jgi:hypothetical protein